MRWEVSWVPGGGIESDGVARRWVRLEALSPTNAVQAYLDGSKAAFAHQDLAQVRAVTGGETFAAQSSTLSTLAQQGEHRDRDYALVGTPEVISNAGAAGFTVVAVIRVRRDVAVNASGQTVRSLHPAQSLSLTLDFQRGPGSAYQLISVCPPEGPGQMTGQALPPSVPRHVFHMASRLWVPHPTGEAARGLRSGSVHRQPRADPGQGGLAGAAQA